MFRDQSETLLNIHFSAIPDDAINLLFAELRGLKLSLNQCKVLFLGCIQTLNPKSNLFN